MNITYQKIEFLGYKELSDDFKFAELRQLVTCDTEKYDEQDMKLLGFEVPQKYRKLLFQVPFDHFGFATILEKYPKSKIIRSISYEPILNDVERMMISKNLMDIAPFMQRQLVRYNGTLFLDKFGMPIYAQNKLSLSGQFSDQDYRIDLSIADLSSGSSDPLLSFAGTKF